MKKKVAAFILMMLLPGIVTFGQVNVIHVNNPASMPVGSGFYYTLPLTVLQVDVVLRVEKQAKGPMVNYAERYLGITDAIQSDNTLFEISRVIITPTAKPDPEEVYYVEMGQRDSKDPRMLLFEVNESGYLVSANNIDAQNRKLPKSGRQIMIDGTEFTSGDDSDFMYSGKVNISTDTIVRRVAVDTTIVEQLSFRSRALDKPDQDFAVEIMAKIEEVRESRYKLLTGFQETAYETGTLQFMDEQLQKLEEEYIALFRGKSFTYFENHTFYFTPPKKQEKTTAPLFMFSANSGISPAKGGIGETVELTLEPAGTGQMIDGFAGKKGQDASQNGIAYRVPGQAFASLKIGKEEIHTEQLTVTQLGTVRRLPFNKFKVEFSPETGGIMMLMLE
ncbi:MAG: DUF4831 family protein [Bacteroidales bacterium]|nr:DUF4831 family protein [Bacteroidales bacterium]